MSDTLPSAGGSIGGGNWGYKGGNSSSSSRPSSGSSSGTVTSIDLSCFAIETDINDYEGEETETSAPVEATAITDEDIAWLVGKLSGEDYSYFVGGVEAFYDDQIATYEGALNGPDGLYALRDRLGKIESDYNLDTRKQYSDERIMSGTNAIIDQYRSYTPFWEKYEREHGLAFGEGYEIFDAEMTYEERVRFLEENSPEYQEMIARERAYISEEFDGIIAAELGDLGITTYAEYVALRDETDSEIGDLEAMLKTAKQLKTSAKYDYLPFLEEYNNYEPPEFDYETYALTFYHDAYIERGGPNNMSQDFSYSKYKALHPEVTPLQFVRMAMKYTTFTGDLHDIECASELMVLAKISDKFPQFEKTYNYLYDKDPALALQYLRDNQHVFNNYEGQMRANDFLSRLGVADGDNDFLEAIANELGISYEGLMDGLGSFGEGLCYTAEALLVALGLMEENRTMSAEEYKKLYILQALLPVDTKIEMGLIYRDENGELHNTDPNSLIDYTITYSGPLLNNNYELSQGLGNMAPSMLVSLYCPAAGSWLMALSSGGNAYHGAMVEGKDYFTALLYGVFTGGSEALSERLLGGLPGLSNVEVTGLKTYLKAVAKEGSQEVFQFVMDKVYRCIAMGEPLPQTPEEWEEFGREAMKEGGYGAILAGVTQIPNLGSAYLSKRHRSAIGLAGVAGVDISSGTQTQTEISPEVGVLTGAQTISDIETEANTEVETQTETNAQTEVNPLTEIAQRCTEVSREEMKQIILSVPQEQRVELIFEIEKILANGKFESTFVSYREHAALHTQAVQEYALKLGIKIETLTPTQIDEIRLAAYFHDLGMSGGIYLDEETNAWKETTSGGKARKNHPLNSAIDIIEFGLVPEGMDAERVALLAMSHSKSTSGIKHMSSQTEWMNCVQKLDDALIASRGTGLDPDAKARLISMINDPQQLAILQAEAMCIRDGDAMSPIALNEKKDTIMQTGNSTHVEVTPLSSAKEAPPIYSIPDSKKEETFVGADKIKDTVVETGEPIESNMSKIIHAGELNVSFDSSTNPSGTTYAATATIADPLSAPEASVYAITERIGEVITYDHLDERSFTIKIPKVNGESIKGLALGDWYIKAIGTVQTDYSAKATKTLTSESAKILGGKPQAESLVVSLQGIDATNPAEVASVVAQYDLPPEQAAALEARCLEYGRAVEFAEHGIHIEFE